MQSYLIDAQVDPAAQTINATAMVRFTPLDDTNSLTFELNNALSLIKVVDEDGRQVPSVAHAAGHERRADTAADASDRASRRADVYL